MTVFVITRDKWNVTKSGLRITTILNTNRVSQESAFCVCQALLTTPQRRSYLGHHRVLWLRAMEEIQTISQLIPQEPQNYRTSDYFGTLVLVC